MPTYVVDSMEAECDDVGAPVCRGVAAALTADDLATVESHRGALRLLVAPRCHRRRQMETYF